MELSSPSSFPATGKAATILASIESAQKLFGNTKRFYESKFLYTVTVSEGDALYSEIHSWFFTALEGEVHRTLTVHTSSSRSSYDASPEFESSDLRPKKISVRYDDAGFRIVRIGPYRIRIVHHIPDDGGDNYRQPRPKKITFYATTHTAQQEVIRKLEEINANRSTLRNPVLKLVNAWGSWRERGDLPARTMESVSLPVEQKTRIVDDLRTFLESEEEYNRLAIPWHRGYMFHGHPGTGKTSLAKALANEFKLDIWYISLSDLKAESSLLGLLSEVGPRSILLLEDIDTVKITHDRDATDPGTISMGSLLNTLDGVATPHGLITIMTTNRFDILDEALTRPGRMDLVEELGWPSVKTISQMFRHFYGVAPSWQESDRILEGVSTAHISEIMKNNMRDRIKAEEKIFRLFEKTYVS